MEASSSSESHSPIRKPTKQKKNKDKTEAQKQADKLSRLLAMPSKFGRCSSHGTMMLPWLHKSGQHAGRIMLRCRLAILCTKMLSHVEFAFHKKKIVVFSYLFRRPFFWSSRLQAMVFFKKPNHERCWSCAELTPDQWSKLPLKLREEYSRLEHALKRGHRQSR